MALAISMHLAASVEQIEPLIEGHREAYEAKKAAETAAKAARLAQIVVEKKKLLQKQKDLAFLKVGRALEIASRFYLMNGRLRLV